ncbi:MAG: DNA replication/repair protein RecF [Motiliproteus sp.]|nr:DNA replication/repair protein RecF [Motiliproteus sp.]
MAIQSLSVSDFRNISHLKLELSPRVNIFSGANGAGKTSILEAIHLLSHGRSFRTGKYKHYIRQQQDQCTLFAEVSSLLTQTLLPLGLQCNLEGELKIRLNGQNIDTISVLAELLPVQLLNSDTFLLLEGSPSVRRQFIDWGGFHADAGFLVAWKAVKRVLKQRNSLLKYGKLDPLVRRVWDAEFVRHAEALDQYRQRYMDALIPCFETVLAGLIDIEGLGLQYYRGWDRKRPLDEVLEQGLERDKSLGFTQVGPQRADLRIRINGVVAAEILSRGQQKLVVSALKVAQGQLLKQTSGRDCIYLIDDLPAELDRNHRHKLCSLLDELQCQLLLTCVDARAFDNCWNEITKVQEFPIEEGSLAKDHGNGSQE